MTSTDMTILVVMAGTAAIAAGAFASITRYLFDRHLADRHAAAPNIIDFYKTYMAHTRRATGRIGVAFWIHSLAAGLFIAIGVGYSIFRFILPRLV